MLIAPCSSQQTDHLSHPHSWRIRRTRSGNVTWWRASSALRRLIDWYRIGSRHSLSLFRPTDLVSQRIEFGFQASELSQLLSRQSFAAGLAFCQRLERVVDPGAFATQLKYKGHGASWA
jgi:hypothetical protein